MPSRAIKARIEDLYQLYSRISAKHLLAVQAENSESVRQHETLMFSYSEAIKKAEDRLKAHRLLCGGK
jgi:hypothetical protein